jgi:histidinol-phosphate aminotransferase
MTNSWKKNLRNITPYTPGEQPKQENIIKLNANENPYPPSPKAIEALQQYDGNLLRLYPDSSAQKLRKAAAKHFGVEENQIFLGNGSDDVIALAFMSCFQSNLPILFPDITYSFYPVWCDLFRVPYETIALQEDFTINPEDYNRPNGGIILPNPNAPTGIGQTKEALRYILEHNQDSIVIIDEAYVDFGAYSCVELLKDYENLLIIHTFSKSRSLAGMRIGIAIGSETIIATLNAVKNSYNSYTVDSLAIEIGTASINDTAYLKETSAKIIHTREWFSKELEQLGYLVYPSESNFVFATHPNVSAKEMFEALKKEGIFIRYFNLPRIDNHLRITIGTDEQMQLLIKHMKQYLS